MVATHPSAIVIGAASGIGLAIARCLSERGGRTGLIDRDGDGLARAMTTLPSCRAAVADVSRREEMRAALVELAGDGPLDHLIYSAGIHAVATPAAATEDMFEAVMRVNVLGFLIAVQEALPHLRRGVARPRAIVAVSSASARMPKVASAVYGASKAALEQFVRTLAVELAPEGIRVNAVAPGTVDTPMLATAGADAFRPSGAGPMGRLAAPGEIARAVAFLCSADAAFVSGHSLAVDGAAGAAVASAPGRHVPLPDAASAPAA